MGQHLCTIYFGRKNMFTEKALVCNTECMKLEKIEDIFGEQFHFFEIEEYNFFGKVVTSLLSRACYC